MLRALLWVLFIPVALGTAFVFARFGEGSFAPYAVFYGWGFLGLQSLGEMMIGSPSVEEAAFVSVAVLYPSCLCFCLGYVVRRRGLRLYGAVLAVHAVGVVLAVVRLDHGVYATPALIQFSYLVSSAILVVLFALDHAVLDHKLKQRNDTPSATE